MSRKVRSSGEEEEEKGLLKSLNTGFSLSKA
jgi:hypothetical protein